MNMSGRHRSSRDILTLRDMESKLNEAERSTVYVKQKYNRLAETYRRRKAALLKTEIELENERKSHDEHIRELDHARRRNEKLTTLLERRTTELAAAQALLPSPGNVTDTQVVEMVQELNYELSQTAIALSESFEGHVQVRATDEVLTRSTRDLEPYLGPGLVKLLRYSRRGKAKLDATTVLQIGFQACIASSVNFFASRWCFASNTTNEDIDAIYGSLRRMEQDYVAMKWRSLTRNYAREAHDKPSTEMDLVEIMARILADATVVAGFALPGENAVSAKANVLSRASREMLEVARLAMKLNGVVGQDFSPYTMVPYIAEPGSPFDLQQMSDGYSGVAPGAQGPESFPSDRKVLCSTDLGLVRLEGTGGKEYTVLVKPTVALDVLLPSPRA